MGRQKQSHVRKLTPFSSDLNMKLADSWIILNVSFELLSQTLAEHGSRTERRTIMPVA